MIGFCICLKKWLIICVLAQELHIQSLFLKMHINPNTRICTLSTFNMQYFLRIFKFLMCRGATLALAAVWDAVGVNVPLLPCVAPATLSHTAASATRGLEADTASDACQDSGITAHPAARVSLFNTAYGLIHGWRRFSTFHCLLSLTKIATYANRFHIGQCIY